MSFVEIVCILDKSGSMSSVKDDAIGGFNTFLEEQKKLPGKANMSLVLFNHEYEESFSGRDIQKVSSLKKEDYIPFGTTALLDAVGRTIDDIGKRLFNTDEKNRPEKVIVVIMTDGQENASKDYKRDKISEMIKHQQEKYNWEFIFLAANIDAFAEANSLNIPSNNTYSYTGDSFGTQSAYNVMTRSVFSYRNP